MDLEQTLETQAFFEHTKIGDIRQLRTDGLIAHISKELNKEIKEDPTSVEEWCDVVILGAIGALRAAAANEHSEHLKFDDADYTFDARHACHVASKVVSRILMRKLQENWFVREWPKNTPEDQACEHVRDIDGVNRPVE